MGYDLKSETGDLTGFSSPGWSMIRSLAEQFGWKPEGTHPPEYWDCDEQWSGEYTGNSRQLVTAGDAMRLADALELALSAPDFESRIESMQTEYQLYLRQASSAAVTLTLSTVPGGEWRVVLQGFIEFCRKGSFGIH